MKNTALMLTQYERYGSIGNDEYIEYFIDEELEIDENMISDYNKFLANNNYETYESDLEVLLCGREPLEVARMTFYGDFRFADDYHKINGYGNIDSFSEYQVVREMKKNKDFLYWYIEENDLIDFEDDFIAGAIKEANNLIKAGY